jgi:ribosomal protein L34E
MEIEKTVVSRRWVIKTLSCLACTIPLSGIGLASPLYAQQKVSKEQAAYQDQPKGKELCSNCVHFVPPAACAVVAGDISPNGWSKYWAAKK